MMEIVNIHITGFSCLQVNLIRTANINYLLNGILMKGVFNMLKDKIKKSIGILTMACFLATPVSCVVSMSTTEAAPPPPPRHRVAPPPPPQHKASDWRKAPPPPHHKVKPAPHHKMKPIPKRPAPPPPPPRHR